MPGTAKPTIGAPYSHTTAMNQSKARVSCSASAPAIQNTAETMSRTSMRR